MLNILTLYDELAAAGVQFFHWRIPDRQAVTVAVGDQIGVFMDFDAINTLAEETVTVAHEGGHVLTGSLHRLSSPYDLIRRHEIRANKWAIKKLVPEDELEAAVADGRTEPWELAEIFGVTEQFIRMAIQFYRCGSIM